MVTTINPTTGDEIARYELDSADTVDRKLTAAHAAFRLWRQRPFAERADLMYQAAKVLRDELETIAREMCFEMGKPITEARAEVYKCAWVCEYYADHAERMLATESAETDASESYVRHDPLGVVLTIMPWNFPVWQVFRQAAPAIMAGNTVLLKHAENTWGCAKWCTRVFEEAGFPEGVFDHLFVDVSDVEGILMDSRIVGVALTGSERAGSAVGALAGRAIKPAVLELGGSDPFIVLADANLDIAVRGALVSRFLNTGQSCIAAKRLIVERPVLQDFVARMRDGVTALNVGDPLAEDTEIGPMARADLREQLASQVDRSVAAGAELLVGGKVPEGDGFYYPPTLLANVKPSMPAFDEELFGPVACVIVADDREHAVALANQTRYGLGASIWSRSKSAYELIPRLDAGAVFVNGMVKSDPRLPFGGTKASGIGRELARQGILAFVNQKTVWIR